MLVPNVRFEREKLVIYDITVFVTNLVIIELVANFISFFLTPFLQICLEVDP